jgi:cytochrome c2
VADLPIELRGVAEELEQGSGFWRSCSGCHESNEGVPTGPFSAVFMCHLGGGCRECGGLGAVWDDTDYDDMAEFMARSDASNPGVACNDDETKGVPGA